VLSAPRFVQCTHISQTNRPSRSPRNSGMTTRSMRAGR
jgi:hypothetical protein